MWMTESHVLCQRSNRQLGSSDGRVVDSNAAGRALTTVESSHLCRSGAFFFVFAQINGHEDRILLSCKSCPRTPRSDFERSLAVKCW